VAANAPDADPPPRLFLARGHGTRELRFRTDVPEPAARTCREIAADLPAWDGPPSEPAVFRPLFAALGWPVPTIGSQLGPAYRFPERPPELPAATSDVEIRLIGERNAGLLERYFPYTLEILEARSPVVGAIVDGVVVAACYSARRRAFASEAGVATEERYRGRGLGPLVVRAWADEVARAGGRPLYSTWWTNVSSRTVAAKLGLIAYAETFSAA
jgi:GNAT superfamily N-acetyltransferase